MVAAAIIGGAVIGGVATNMGANKAASATSAGARTGTQAINQSTNQGLRDIQSGTAAGIKTETNAAAPYVGLGKSAIPKLETLLGLKGGGAAAMKALQSTPGYQFAQQQGDQGTINAATASGMNLSGNTLESLSNFNQGLATSTFNTEVGNLEGLVAGGQNAALTSGGAISGMQAGAGSQEAQLLSNKGTSIANVDIGQGTNLANIGMAQAASNANIASSAGNDFLLSSMMKNPQAVDGGDFYASDTLKRFKPCRN